MINNTIILSLLFSIYAIPANSITFKPSLINKKNEPNYLRFEGKSYNYSNSFEKIAADFNGDGFDDILSLGGELSLINDDHSSIGDSHHFIPVEMMIYQEGNYVTHDIDIQNYSNNANIVDIDSDDDLDIVMMNGDIAINDGLANFSTIKFTNNRFLSEPFFTADIDTDGDLDIISKSYIFKNDGNLEFSEVANEMAADSKLFHVVDINNDNFVDLIILSANGLQSWINDGSGNFELLGELQIPEEIFIVHNLNVTEDNLQNLLVVFHDNQQDKVLLLQNDGLGNFESNQLALKTENIEFDTLRIGKLYNQDSNNDGGEDLWIAASFNDKSSCQNSQNLLFMYSKTSDGNWQYQITLHSEGVVKESVVDNKMTVDSLPTIVDLNNDGLPDVVFSGDRSQTWLSRVAVHNQIGITFQLSQTSKNQYIQSIDSVDYDNDGNVDIFSAAQYFGNCPILGYAEGLDTAAYHLSSTLWINDGNGDFNTFSSPYGGGNDFLSPYKYMIFADLESDGVQNIIATIPEYGEQSIESYYIYPRVVDPSLIIKLPEATTNAKVVNLDKIGETKEIVMIADTDEAPIIVLAFNNGQFIEITRFEFGARYGEFKLADMDNDGNIDIVASKNVGQDNSTTIWYNDGNREFTRGQDFADNAFGIAVLDFNNDGLLDLFSSSHDIRLNQGNREFEKIRYNSSFWSTPLGFPLLGYLVPKKIEVTDFNNDGKDDVLFTNHKDYYVYINDSSQDQILFYLAYSTQFSTTYDQYNAVLADINNDNEMDFVVNTGNDIQINTQLQESPVVGIYYDPDYSGHGFSIYNLGKKNLYYSIFYSYDELGKPEWYATLNRYAGFETELDSSYHFTVIGNSRNIRYLYDYETQMIQADLSAQNMGFLTFSSYNLNRTLDKVFYLIGDDFNNWNTQPLIHESQTPDNDLSGIWWAGSNDSGWGISLSFVQRENTQEVVAILYFYDEAGEPRWLIGQQSGFELNQDVSIDMKQINGYSREQNYVELTEFLAGTITLNLKQASNNINEAGTMTMDVFYPNDQFNQNNWIRNDIPIALFSKPIK